MKTTKKEVRTIYHIELEKEDVQKAFDKAKELHKRLGEDGFKTCHGEAFKSIMKEDLTVKELTDYKNRIIKHWNGNREDTDTLSYIIEEFLGFDRVDNFGYNKEGTETRRMSAWIEGDHI